MKVTLIRPPVLAPSFNMVNLVTPPLGLAYVAAAVRAAGHEVTVIDSVGLAVDQFTPHAPGVLHGLGLDEVVARVPADADAIGVSIQFSFEWPVGRQLLARIRRCFPDVFLFAGGEHVTAEPEFSMRESGLDAVVPGEGERTAVEVLRAWAHGGREALAEVRGIFFRDREGVIAHSGKAARIEALETVSRPAWDLLPLETYLDRGFGFGVNRGRTVPVLASRGCPYQCTFCSSPAMWTTRWAARDPHDVLDEIAELQRRYRAENFDFYDLTMIVKRRWIVDFCHAIEARGMSFVWQLPSGTRSEAIDAEVAELLYRTGCRNLSYAPESGSDETLKRIKKKILLSRMLTSMRAAVKSGLNVKTNFIIGFPHETWRHLAATCVFIAKTAVAGIHDVSVWVFVPYPGSELYRELREAGRIPALDDAYFHRLAAYADITATHSYSEALDRRALLITRVAAMVMFYGIAWTVRPWRGVTFFWNALCGTTQSRSEDAVRAIARRMTRAVLGRISPSS